MNEKRRKRNITVILFLDFLITAIMALVVVVNAVKGNFQFITEQGDMTRSLLVFIAIVLFVEISACFMVIREFKANQHTKEGEKENGK